MEILHTLLDYCKAYTKRGLIQPKKYLFVVLTLESQNIRAIDMNCHFDMDTTTEVRFLKTGLVLITKTLVNIARFEQRFLTICFYY